MCSRIMRLENSFSPVVSVWSLFKILGLSQEEWAFDAKTVQDKGQETTQM
jgi:hypothetical protein